MLVLLLQMTVPPLSKQAAGFKYQLLKMFKAIVAAQEDNVTSFSTAVEPRTGWNCSLLEQSPLLRILNTNLKLESWKFDSEDVGELRRPTSSAQCLCRAVDTSLPPGTSCGALSVGLPPLCCTARAPPNPCQPTSTHGIELRSVAPSLVYRMSDGGEHKYGPKPKRWAWTMHLGAHNGSIG